MAVLSLSGGVSRRLSTEHEVRIAPEDLAQPFDIDISLPPAGRRPVPGLPGYHITGIDAAVEGIARAAELGVPLAVLRFVNPGPDRYEALDRQAAAFADVRERLGAGAISLVVDPFALALNENLSWGVPGGDGVPLLAESVELLAAIARVFGQAGADGLFTLGRIESEVEVTRAELDRIRPRTKIYSFSQNSETSTAYIYHDTGKPLDTGQKILPGNCVEMTLRALLDIWDGTDVCIVKPMENFHLTKELSQLLSSEQGRERFLGSDHVGELAGHSPAVAGKLTAMRADPAAMAARCANVLVGGYAVSGTSYMLSLLEAARGPAMSRARLEEIWLNAAAASHRLGPLIDRNAVPFLLGGGLC